MVVGILDQINIDISCQHLGSGLVKEWENFSGKVLQLAVVSTEPVDVDDVKATEGELDEGAEGGLV